MANAGANNEPKIPLKKIEGASSIKVEYFEKFIADLVLLLDKTGKPYHRKPIEIPRGKELIFWEGPRDSNLAPQEVQQSSDSYLFYADLVNVVGQAVEWYFDNGNDRTKKLLKPILPFVRDEKILQNLYGIDHILEDSVIAQSFQVKVLPIINRLFIAAAANSENGIEGVDDSEYLLEQKKKAEEAELEEEKKLAAAIAGAVGGDADSAVVATRPSGDAQAEQTGQETGLSTDTKPIPTDQATEEPIRGLKISDLKSIEAEVAWISSPLVYSLFGRHGIPQDVVDAHPELRQELYEHVRQAYLKSRSKSRTEVYSWARTSLSSDFLGRLEAFYQEYSQSLTPEKQTIFLDSVKKTEGLLKSYTPIPADISKLFDQDVASILGTDNPAVSKNIKTAIETLVITHGVPLQIVTEDNSGTTHFKVIESQEKDALYIISRLPDGYLKLIFGIRADQKLTKEQVEKLRAIALGYAQQRAIELALITHSEKVARGILETNAGTIGQLAKPQAPTANLRSFAVAMPGFIDVHKDVAKDGAETVSRALNNGAKDQMIRQIRLWNQLDDTRKWYIIEHIGLNPEQITDMAVPPERLRLFNIAEVMLKAEEEMEERDRLFKELVAKDQMLIEFAMAQQELIQEETLRTWYRDKIRELIGEEEWRDLQIQYEYLVALQREAAIPDEYAFEPSFEDLSPQEIMDFYEDGGGMGGSESGFSGQEPKVEPPQDSRSSSRGERGRGSRSRASRSKSTRSARKKLGKKLGTKKATDKAKKKFEDYLSKVAALGGPWGKAAGFAIKHRKTAAAIAGLAGAMIVGGLIKMFTAGKAALLGGIIGGVAGGVVGFFVGGPVGVVVGATLGASAGGYLGAKFSLGGTDSSGLFRSGGNLSAGQATSATQSARSAAQAARMAQASQAATIPTANIAATAMHAIATLPIGVLAPMGVIATIAMFSLYVLFIVMAAFLVPLPIGYDFDDLPSLPPGLNACWPTTGILTQLAEPSHTGTHRVGGLVQAIDIWCYGPDCPKEGDGDWPPAVYSSHNGIATIPPQNSYGIHVRVKSPEGYETIYAHLSDIVPGLQNGDTVGRGQLLGYMGNTGYCYDSAGNIGTIGCTHLHYEYSGGLISTIVPQGEYQSRKYVVENCSTGGVPNHESEGYLAIGPLTSNNVVASTTNDVANPSATCSWQGSKGLEVAVNANFFNKNMNPVGFAGENGAVRYYEDSETSAAFMEQLTTLVDNSGSFSTVKGKNHNPINWEMAISGVYSSGASTNTSLRQRTAISIGTAKEECSSKYAGDRVLFLAVMPSATFDQIEANLRDCGATTVVHMDGGGSSAFCSNSHTYPSVRSVPVNIGMKEAEVRDTFGNDPTPSDSPGLQ